MAELFVSDGAMFGELANVWRLFAPDRHLIRAGAPPEMAELGVAIYPASRNDQSAAQACLYQDGTMISAANDDTVFLALRQGDAETRRQLLHQAKRAMYRLLADHFNQTSPWGALTGIRPTKLYRELSFRHGAQPARREFLERYLVSEERTDLASRIVKTQTPFLTHFTAVYCGIPFCPTRCSYCSFIAQDVVSGARARTGYLNALLTELESGAGLADPADVRSIYVGGGTPTVLSEQELNVLLGVLRRLFPYAEEFTVEAGRPDSINDSKLGVMQQNGVTRVCVNPQTTSDATLQRIGRGHTTDSFFHAMRLTQGKFSSVNSDIIVGLPGETEVDVQQTLSDVLSFMPQNVTVHALSIKNASEFAKDRYSLLPTPDEAARVCDTASHVLYKAGYRPYYLYRQKYMTGNLENIGWSLPGHESLYNIGNMEETADVLAFGAGGISKRVCDNGTRIERAANVKDPSQYVERANEMLERKRRLFGCCLA